MLYKSLGRLESLDSQEENMLADTVNWLPIVPMFQVENKPERSRAFAP
jgi:hypothetical protein